MLRRSNAVTAKEVKRVCTLATAHARVAGRLGGTKKPSALDVQLDIAKSLRVLIALVKDFVHGGAGATSDLRASPDVVMADDDYDEEMVGGGAEPSSQLVGELGVAAGGEEGAAGGVAESSGAVAARGAARVALQIMDSGDERDAEEKDPASGIE